MLISSATFIYSLFINTLIKKIRNKTIKNQNFYFFSQLPEAQRQVDESMVNDNEINTEKNFDNDIGDSGGGGGGESVGGIGQGFNTGGISATYRSMTLKKWYPAPTVQEQHGKPGELGKAVKIPDDMKALTKEKFKENQFNLVASDMISLNRSLTDVRHEK